AFPSAWRRASVHRMLVTVNRRAYVAYGDPFSLLLFSTDCNSHRLLQQPFPVSKESSAYAERGRLVYREAEQLPVLRVSYLRGVGGVDRGVDGVSFLPAPHDEILGKLLPDERVDDSIPPSPEAPATPDVQVLDGERVSVVLPRP